MNTERTSIRTFAVPDAAHALKFTDTIESDQDAHLLYAVDNWSAGVDVFDIATDEARYLRTVTIRGPLYRLALAPDLHRLYVNPADGMWYVTCTGDNLLHQVDPVTDTLRNSSDVGDDCHPNGLAINPATNEALLACNNRARAHTVIWDLTKHAIASIIEESGAGDGAIYDATVDRFFFAASNHSSGPVMGIFGGHPARFLANVPTRVGASWVAYDRAHGLVYAPTFEGGRPGLISFPLPPA